MNESSDEPPLQDRIRFWAREKAYDSKFSLFGGDSHGQILPLANPRPKHDAANQPVTATAGSAISTNEDNSQGDRGGHNVSDKRPETLPPPAPPPVVEEQKGEESAPLDTEPKPGSFKRFLVVVKIIMLSSWINVGLVFVPVGIVLGALNKASHDGHVITPSIVFAINAIAIIPLAGLLSFATESVAVKLGDTMGALLNVSFGNAVELIIFMYVIAEISTEERKMKLFARPNLSQFVALNPFVKPSPIALVAKEIRIVQASLLGSILANLLLILGMCFLFGGLRFREQLYNSTVTQMSACLLSLSVISLLLPTAFHASFNNTDLADRAVIKVSRGTSVILLLVYVLYLLFQLKSHAYMYESTPQHKIDEESHPGVLADFLGSSSSSDSSSSSSSDSDDSSKSASTAKRFRRRFTRRKRRKSSASSKDTPSMPSVNASVNMSPSINGSFLEEPPFEYPQAQSLGPPHNLEAVESGEEADMDRAPRRRVAQGINFTTRDFETGETTTGEPSQPEERRSKKRGRKHRKHDKKRATQADIDEKLKEVVSEQETISSNETAHTGNHVGFVGEIKDAPESGTKKPFNIRNLSTIRPVLPKVLSSNVFTHPAPSSQAPAGYPAMSEAPQIGSTLRRASSLPDRLNQRYTPQTIPPVQPLPHIMPVTSRPSASKEEAEKKHISTTASICLLLCSTGLVAACAEFLVDSIDYLVDETGVSQAFIGLIILPIVGNAAEHVTAVTVASKNKMDLAIGVAVGSSIQIALFVTPIIVLLGWCLDTEMSLYFSLFETVSLFVSAFIVGFLILDGRSNYLEGALLIAAYIIIAVLAFFYPSCENLSTASGPHDSSGNC